MSCGSTPYDAPTPLSPSPESASVYPSHPTQENLTRDAEFYFTDIIFQVEDTLFKLPRQKFEANSDFFHQMFTLRPPNRFGADGLSDDQPLKLQGIGQAEFRVFLRVFYRSYPYQPIDLEKDQWISALKLATMWDFTAARDLAISSLHPFLDPIEQVALSNEYHIKEWLLPALNELAKRPEPITFEEGSKIGFDVALKLAAIRESVGIPVPTPQATLTQGLLGGVLPPLHSQINNATVNGPGMQLWNMNPNTTFTLGGFGPSTAMTSTHGPKYALLPARPDTSSLDFTARIRTDFNL